MKTNFRNKNATLTYQQIYSQQTTCRLKYYITWRQRVHLGVDTKVSQLPQNNNEQVYQRLWLNQNQPALTLRSAKNQNNVRKQKCEKFPCEFHSKCSYLWRIFSIYFCDVPCWWEDFGVSGHGEEHFCCDKTQVLVKVDTCNSKLMLSIWITL